MKRKGVPSKLVNIFKFIFENRKVCVKYQNSFSDEWIVHIDVRQGGLTSAYMFCLYLDAILRQIDEQSFECMSDTRKVNVQA